MLSDPVLVVSYLVYFDQKNGTNYLGCFAQSNGPGEIDTPAADLALKSLTENESLRESAALLVVSLFGMDVELNPTISVRQPSNPEPKPDTAHTPD